MKRFILGTVAICLLFVPALAMADGVELLSKTTIWHAFQQTGPLLVAPAASKPPEGWRDDVTWRFDSPRSQPPAAEWKSADFDDQHWIMVNNPAQSRSGSDRTSSTTLYFRVNVGISDPAQVAGLTLSLRYRGGVVVYVNGTEVGRKEMPDGKIAPLTPANEYPLEVYTSTANDKEKAVLRTRTAEIAIPNTLLRKGINVVAIENHHAPYRQEALFGDRFSAASMVWPTAGIISANLKATTNAGIDIPQRPAIRIWNAGTYEPIGREVSDADTFAALKPVTMQAARNATASGQVIVSGDAPLGVITAVPAALQGPNGATIPASTIHVRFALPRDDDSKRFAPLSDTAPVDAKLVPVWISIDVPADAKPGVYKGTLVLKAQIESKVSLQLEVFDWVMPEPNKWKTWSLTYQSPETLASQYKVPLWSDAHFALIEQSMAFQAKLGQKMAVIYAINSSLLARKTMVLYRHEGGKIVPDLSAVEKYLTLYQKYMGTPDTIMLHLWDSNVDNGRITDRKAVIPVTFRDGDTFKEELLPQYGQPGSDELWQAVVAGIKEIMVKLNWPEKRLMFGQTNDESTGAEVTAFFAKNFPDIPWVVYTHGTPPSAPLKLGFKISPGQGGGRNNPGWVTREYPHITNLRQHLEQQCDPFNYRVGALVALIEGFNGPGGIGLDYWSIDYLDDKGRKRSYGNFQGGNLGNYWFRIIRGAPVTLLAPGPQGPISTILFENYREGFQDAQVMIYVASNAKDPKLPTELAKRASDTPAHLIDQGDLRNWNQGAGHGWYDEIGRLYRIAAEMKAVIGQPE